jgi:hypothetical protein
LILVTSLASAQTGELQVRHLYELSDFTGPIPYSDVIVHVDRDFDEVYGVVGNTVRVFNGAGMETYRFEHDPRDGAIYDLVVEESGDIFLLTRKYVPGGSGTWKLVRCNYRGEPIEAVEIDEFPGEFATLEPNKMVLRNGQIYLVSKQELRAVVITPTGDFVCGYDFTRLLDLEEDEVPEMFGFDVAPTGKMLFTVPVLFRAFVVSPDETVVEFGSPGSAPGKFGIVSGISADDHGHYLITDKLRRVVMVFEAESLRFVGELGGRDDKFALSRPTQLAVGNANRLYITQSQQKGVTVFSVTPNGVRMASAPEPMEAPTKGGNAGSTVSNQGSKVSGTKPRIESAATAPRTSD